MFLQIFFIDALTGIKSVKPRINQQVIIFLNKGQIGLICKQQLIIFNSSWCIQTHLKRSNTMSKEVKMYV